jgi:hypothetical protein
MADRVPIERLRDAGGNEHANDDEHRRETGRKEQPTV